VAGLINFLLIQRGAPVGISIAEDAPSMLK
jgi:hypothetical protein